MHQRELWSKIIKDGNEMKAAPFYLVYQGVSAKETDLEWPYNLIKYTLSLMMKTSHSCFQKKIQRQLGYELFKKPSLVMPLIKLEETWVPIKLPKECNRILEQKQLKAFILNPSSFRHGKMPKPANLNSKI
jgi:hypothetical protein